MHNPHIPSALLCLALLAPLAPQRALATVDFPGPDPGAARVRVTDSELVLENGALAWHWTRGEDRLRPGRFVDKLAGATFAFDGTELFSFELARTPSPVARRIRASDLRMVDAPVAIAIRPEPGATRLADRRPGRALVARFAPSDGAFEVRWRARLRDGSNYIRQEITIHAGTEPIELGQLTLLELPTDKGATIGSVDGSPARAGNVFAGCEHPMSRNGPAEADAVGPARVRCVYPYQITIRPGEPVALGSVLGVLPAGQARRGFLYYIERERAYPYRTFLHYNCGYELGCRFWQLRKFGAPGEFDAFLARQEALWLDGIATFGRELVEKRGATLDSFVHDHGWDDTNRVWQFHQGFPRGLSAVRAAAARFKSAPGIWFSPWGGYSGRAQRVEAGQRQGFETSKLGLALAGPRYFNRFRDACLGMTRDYGVNYFKFDGFAAGNGQDGAGAYPGDVEALLRICADLRQVAPAVYLNPTTGTWPSPFWLLWADAIWRQQSDAGFLGKGSDRQQWLTYRDNATLHGTVERGPLFPISSLMLHGIMIHKFAFKNPYDPKSTGVSRAPTDLIAEIRSYFATGTGMQELHIDPSLISPPLWDAIAEAANWSRANADVLADTHWIGGDPTKAEVYGWASWARRKGILTLRNPSEHPATFALDIAHAFELPADAPGVYRLECPWRDPAAPQPFRVTRGRPHTFALAPFQVLTLDAAPEPPSPNPPPPPAK